MMGAYSEVELHFGHFGPDRRPSQIRESFSSMFFSDGVELGIGVAGTD
jgi:hypothetical protein